MAHLAERDEEHYKHEKMSKYSLGKLKKCLKQYGLGLKTDVAKWRSLRQQALEETTVRNQPESDSLPLPREEWVGVPIGLKNTGYFH